MATKKIKGITIEIGGDTSSFVKSLKEADSAIRQTNQNLKNLLQDWLILLKKVSYQQCGTEP